MPTQRCLASHQADLGTVAHLHMRQLGFLKIAVDPKGLLINHRQACPALAHVVTHMQVEVGHIAVDRGLDDTALQVAGHNIAAGFGGLQAGFCHAQTGTGCVKACVGLAGLCAGICAAFCGDHFVGQCHPPLGLGAPHGARCLALRHLGFGLGHLLPRTDYLGFALCQLVAVACRIDRKQHIPFCHALVVAHPHVSHQARDIRRHIDNVGTHTAIACPRRVHIRLPQRMGP